MTTNTYSHLNASFLRGSLKGQVDSILKTRVNVLEYALPDDSPEHLKCLDFLNAIAAKDIVVAEDTPAVILEKIQWVRTGLPNVQHGWNLPKPSTPPAWYETFYAGIQTDPDYNYAKTLEAMRSNPELAKSAPKPTKAESAPIRAKQAEAKKLGRQKASVDDLLQYPFKTQLDKVRHLSDAHITLWLNYHNENPEMERSTLTAKQHTNLKYLARQTGISLNFGYAVEDE